MNPELWTEATARVATNIDPSQQQGGHTSFSQLFPSDFISIFYEMFGVKELTHEFCEEASRVKY